MKIPVIFNLPVWRGRIKARVAKKHLHRWTISYFITRSELFAHLGVGDYINNCDGYNSKIIELHPQYYTIGRKGYGQILIGLNIMTTGGRSCSLVNCGIEPELSRQVVIDRFISSIKEDILSDLGKYWLGSKWEKEAQKAQARLTELESGGENIIGSRGEKLL